MAAVDEVNTQYLAMAKDETTIRQEISAIFWHWFDNNQDKRVTVVKFWFISKKVYVRDLVGLFELLFGPDTAF